MMKTILILFVAFASHSISAQNGDKRDKNQKQELKENFSPEQRAELFSKRMTLNLDLNDEQQKQVKELFLNKKKERQNLSQNKKELTSEEKFEHKTTQINRRIAMKSALKKILTPEQYEKWESRNKDQRSHTKRLSKNKEKQ